MRFPPILARVRGLRALDLLNLFIADAQTGFGAFLAVYLASHKWTVLQIGAMLSIGTVATIASQIPAGALVDAMRSKRLALAGGIAAITLAALLLALLPYQLPVAVAELLHGFASCVLTPAVAAVSLRLVGHAGFADRLGRNARFAAIGNATAAAAMGALGTYVSTRSVFLLTAALAAPALFTLHRVGAEPAPASVQSAVEGAPKRLNWYGIRQLLGDRRLLAFGACVILFHMANAALLPIAATVITAKVGAYASLTIAACIVVPQCVVALLSPMVGRRAMLWGRRAVLLVGWSAIPLRAAVFAILPAPALIVAAQALDGISAAVFGVMVPLVAADLTRGRGRFNLCVGIFGLATGIGATISTSLAGWIADAMGDRIAFAALAGIGMAGVALLAAAMPETAPDTSAAAPAPADMRRPTVAVTRVRPAQRMEARRPGLRAERRRGYARAVRGGAEWR